MFVGSSMEDHLRAEIGENAIESWAYPGHRAITGWQRQGREVLPQFEHGFENAVLAMAKQDEHLRTPAGNLAADLTAD